MQIGALDLPGVVDKLADMGRQIQQSPPPWPAPGPAPHQVL